LAEASIDVKESYRDTVDELYDLRQDIAMSWEKMESTTEEEFAEVREDLANAVYELDMKLNQAENEIERAFNT
jgi:hypothetical protein